MFRRAVPSSFRWASGDDSKAARVDSAAAVADKKKTAAYERDDDERTDVAESNASDEEERLDDEEEEEEEEEVEGELLLLSDKWDEFNRTAFKYEDVDYAATAMGAPSISGECRIVLGEPFVIMEKAPQNSRRIFAGIDIPASVEMVWNVMTDYENLQKVVPNMLANEVLDLFTGKEKKGRRTDSTSVGGTRSDADRTEAASRRRKGSLLRQTGGIKVMGLTISSTMTLEVREWPAGLPEFAHSPTDGTDGSGGGEDGRESERYVFARPFTVPSLPHKDISMQNVEGDRSDFRMYQGVWRMQPLPGCAPEGEGATRLAYAVDVAPLPYLPVALV
eukprot:CAMPEP_0172556870 /NCGR_PEP_ID=MMETSP1067-20121228/69662_1 /TAXON_ID=265564 ORGANISM="Thalassiosira punctigera, Strain Tpunct2005C2" /NCGR_SAMPLE_ID=MMETSP1067 /ASSEMBLY_ACC=CAM_ASM_000444 /LENGTH=333 /DNA_ID=CAMNT_0013345789 /DNA_START=36 /DNA_END=1034 /DNA_ORIENTATION=+